MSRSVSDVSIITVNWNGREHLEVLLPSLLPLGAKEILVVDNGSQDGSVAFLNSNFPEVQILANKTNEGFSVPNNRAAEEAKGKFVAFINNDMRADPNWLQEAVRRLENAPCVASRILNWEGTHVDFNGSSLHYLGYALQKDIGEPVGAVDQTDRVLFPCGGAMMIERDLFLDSGGFDEDFFAVYEDVDLGWRLWVLGHEVAFAPRSIVYHRGHGTFQAHANERLRFLMHRNALLLILKNYEDQVVEKVFPQAIVQAIRRAVQNSGVEPEHFFLWAKSRHRLKKGDEAVFLGILDALNHLVAVDDVLRLLPRMLQKRRRIQSRRVRRDEEILRLFEDPLRPIVQEFSYIQDEIRDIERLGLHHLLKLEDHLDIAREAAESFSSGTELRLERIRDELRALNYLGSGALSHPPSQEPPHLRNILWSLKNRGLRETARSIRKRLSRGG